MRLSFLFAALLALPLAAAAQTAPPRQVTEVTEDLDPATGKVIRRTTRTYDAPADAPANKSASKPAGTPAPATADAPTEAPATDGQVSDFFREKTAVGSLTAPALLDAYARFMETVRDQRQAWKPADWTAAAAVMSRLNARYEQLRDKFVLDDKLTVRAQQAEFQALRTAKQLSRTLSDKL